MTKKTIPSQETEAKQNLEPEARYHLDVPEAMNGSGLTASAFLGDHEEEYQYRKSGIDKDLAAFYAGKIFKGCYDKEENSEKD